MGDIDINLRQCFSLARFVSARRNEFEFHNAINHLPPSIGIYVVINITTGNAYVGIAANLHKRFGARQEAAVVFGLDVTVMEHIYVWFAEIAGDIQVSNTNRQPDGGVVGHQAPAHLPPINTEMERGGLWAQIDGRPIDIEAVLIRQYIEHSTVTFNTNTLKRNAFRNPTGQAVTVTVRYCNSPAPDNRAAGQMVRVVEANGFF